MGERSHFIDFKRCMVEEGTYDDETLCMVDGSWYWIVHTPRGTGELVDLLRAAQPFFPMSDSAHPAPPTPVG